MTEHDIFAAAIKLTSDQRSAFLTAACGPDTRLREQVDALLLAHDESRGLLPKQADRELESTYLGANQASPGMMIGGRYKLLEAIGEGGMGSVWLAEQREPVKRKVAVKLVKAGMDSKQVLARFEAERQALALMDHPNIAKVFDGGMTDQGRPYSIMEYVKGVPLTAYCDSARLSLKERLNLFLPVCQAVQHAHQKGIIHRDLKPSNILICLYDGKPVPKVIDFGLAKAVNQALTEHSLHTGHGVMVGTPLYMSPEQAEHNNLDVDTRTDIYSLGVILYELLTGSTPLERQQLKDAAYNEILRLIKEVEPPKPSERISGSASLPSIAAQRNIEPDQLRRSVIGDLDWIVMKALDKERSRRFETANGLARDVERFLNDEAVEACPPSAGYKLRKYMRRHRGQVLAVSAVLATLLLGMAGTTWGLFEAKRQERIALAEVVAKETARQQEAERAEGERIAKLEAEKARDETEQVLDYLVAAFRKSDPEADGATLTVVEMFEQAAEELEATFPNQPAIQARLLNAIGETYLGLGLYPKAVTVFQRAMALSRNELNSDHERTLESMNNLAAAYESAGRLPEAMVLSEQTVKLSQDIYGSEHPKTLSSMNNLASVYHSVGRLSDALALFERTLELTKALFGEDHPSTLTSMNNLASAYESAARLKEALPLFEQVLKLRTVTLGPNHPETLDSMNNLAVVYKSAGRLAEALTLFEKTLELRKAKLGAEHPSTIQSMGNLAGAYEAVGRLAEALPLYEQTLQQMKTKLGPAHQDTILSMNNLALAYKSAGRLAEALPLHEQTLVLAKTNLGPTHPGTLMSMGNLAGAYKASGKITEAITLYEQTLDVRKVTLGPEHSSTLQSMNNLAMAYKSVGRFAEALPILEETFARRKVKLGPDHPSTLSSMHNLAHMYASVDRLPEALPMFEQALDLMNVKLGAEHPDTITLMDNLANAYLVGEQPEKALPLFDRLIAGHRDRAMPDDPAFAGGLAEVCLALLKHRQYPTAETYLQECLTIREKKMPDEWVLFDTKSMLGSAMAGQKKFQDAEPLLLEGCSGIINREARIPPTSKTRLNEAVQRLVDLYTDWEKPEEAEKWRSKLDAPKSDGEMTELATGD